jgi:hypothetical protein
MIFRAGRTFPTASALRRRTYPVMGHTALDLNPDGKLDLVVCSGATTPAMSVLSLSPTSRSRITAVDPGEWGCVHN